MFKYANVIFDNADGIFLILENNGDEFSCYCNDYKQASEIYYDFLYMKPDEDFSEWEGSEQISFNLSNYQSRQLNNEDIDKIIINMNNIGKYNSYTKEKFDSFDEILIKNNVYGWNNVKSFIVYLNDLIQKRKNS